MRGEHSHASVRAEEAQAITRLIQAGCDFQADRSGPVCGADIICLHYDNGGYGEPWWTGRCCDHIELPTGWKQR